jgi:hypothetical protein
MLTNAELIRNAETMFGTGSVQHLRAIKKFGAKPASARVLTPCYCDSVYHAQGC